MSPRQEAKLIKISPFTIDQATKIGVSQPRLSRLVQKGIIKRIARGIYLHPKAKISPEEIGFQIACTKFGSESAIGGLSALFYYKLIEQVPSQIWMTVPQEKRSRETNYRLMRTKSNLRIGIISRQGYRIASLERSLLEALKMSSKIGERIALKAVRTAIANRQTTETKLGKMAKDLSLESVLARHFEAIAL